jgi:hypothetical protein
LKRADTFRPPRRRFGGTPVQSRPNLTSQPFKHLIQLEVACQVALGALPRLPEDTEQALRNPIQELCDVTRGELQRIDPSYKARRAPSPNPDQRTVLAGTRFLGLCGPVRSTPGREALEAAVPVLRRVGALMGNRGGARERPTPAEDAGNHAKPTPGFELGTPSLRESPRAASTGLKPLPKPIFAPSGRAPLPSRAGSCLTQT